MDKLFRVETLSAMPIPEQVIYAAMHQDYCESFVFDDLYSDKEVWKKSESEWKPTGKFVSEWDGPSNEECGDRIVRHLLAGNRGHFGPLEHPQIVLNVGYFPHSTMQQLRTHRVGVSFDVQSFRYTGQRILEVANGERSVEDVFYLRPVGEYSDRQGKRYQYTQGLRLCDENWCKEAAIKYAERIEQGFSEEHARGLIPFDIRQHWVMSANVRSLLHILDMRWKADAQLECQQLCDLIWPHFENWVPSVAKWYLANRAKKAKLAP